MSKISLEKFIEKTKGKKIATPWGTQKGQCVSLIQQYIKQCLNQKARPMGHAKDWVINYVSRGYGKVVKNHRKGDILVFYNDGINGHIAIYVSYNKIYDQNNGRHDNKKTGFCKIYTTDYIILRPNSQLVSDKNYKYVNGVYKTLYDLNVRDNASTNSTINTVYKKGTAFNVSFVVYSISTGVWGRTKAGYVCLQGAKGKIYCKKL